jgi:hypothetical protein
MVIIFSDLLHDTCILDTELLAGALAHFALSFIDEHISIIPIEAAVLPIPQVDTGVIKFDPLAITIDDGVVVASF